MLVSLSFGFSARRPFQVVMARANYGMNMTVSINGGLPVRGGAARPSYGRTWKFWLVSLSTFLMAESGKVKPLPAGPPPCVWPVKAKEVDVLADCEKLVGVVEKHM